MARHIRRPFGPAPRKSGLVVMWSPGQAMKAPTQKVRDERERDRVFPFRFTPLECTLSCNLEAVVTVPSGVQYHRAAATSSRAQSVRKDMGQNKKSTPAAKSLRRFLPCVSFTLFFPFFFPASHLLSSPPSRDRGCEAIITRRTKARAWCCALLIFDEPRRLHNSPRTSLSLARKARGKKIHILGS